MCDDITAALAEVENAVAELDRVQNEGIDRLRLALPAAARIEPEITAEAPVPLFTTGDDFVSATERLIDHKKLNNGDE